MPAKVRVNALFLSFVSSHWQKIVIPIVAIATLVVFLFIPREQASTSSSVSGDVTLFPELIEEPEEIIPIEEIPSVIIVDVKGAVRHPGVYSMQEGDRIIDVIAASGGYLPDADSRLLNHAAKVVDELVIYVPIEGEEMPEENSSFLQGESASKDDGKVNINSADLSQLTTIPGIGPAKASAILAYRDENGLFKSTSDLMNISGIGQKTFDKLEHLIKLD
ncbi:helix-hairpin-helix domain-containing protein [Sporosarcina sp. CAU 1771]